MTDHSFPRSVRLVRTAEYDRVFRRPQRTGAPGLLILAVRQDPPAASRLGLVVPKKVLKHAVQRNRVKRLMRETFRRIRLTVPGMDTVVIAKAGIDAMDNATLHATLKRLWLQINRRLSAPPSS